MDEALDGHFAGDLQEDEGPGNVGLNHRSRLVDAAIDVGFRGEVNHRVAAGHGLFHAHRITDIAFYESIFLVAGDGVKICEIPGVGQLVKIYDFILRGIL